MYRLLFIAVNTITRAVH